LLEKIENGCGYHSQYGKANCLSTRAACLLAIRAKWHVRKNRDTWESLIRILDPHRFSLNGRPAIDVSNREHVAFRETHISKFWKAACNSRICTKSGVKAFVMQIIASISHQFAPLQNPLIHTCAIPLVSKCDIECSRDWYRHRKRYRYSI